MKTTKAVTARQLPARGDVWETSAGTRFRVLSRRGCWFRVLWLTGFLRGMSWVTRLRQVPGAFLVPARFLPPGEANP